ncbi:MAG: cysteine--tRNA ligase [Candidatus Wildermuthbacteria bacterium]|nr:cysteine--tRNA ligase [Candidatus Wildermuthbacteria bacterium]
MITISNTISLQKEPVRARKGKTINLFVCGPTVYDFSHIGHARTYIAFDVIAKYLNFSGFRVFYLQNITDIDDKIIQRAKESEESPKTLARRFETEYYKDIKALGVNSVTTYARATDYIPQIISQVERLLEKGFAYEAEDGIYFDVKKFSGYGKLSGRTYEQAQDAVSRIDESVKKRNKGDFALWKVSKADEPSWKSPWGMGRPGWHIEDTAITEHYFGPQYDIHGGARDLIFPHHEAEIAQMEAVSGKEPLVRYWLHTGFLNVRGEKMSKSLGNFITIRNFLEKHSSRFLRFFVLKSHYRSPIDYNDDAMVQTDRELDRIDEFIERLRSIAVKGSATPKLSQVLKTKRKEFFDAMDDDFNTPLAIAKIFELISEVNRLADSLAFTKQDSKSIFAFLKEIDVFLGFIFIGKKKSEAVPKEIEELAFQREEFRKKQDWQKADEVRQAIEKKGWVITDTSLGPKFKKI